MDEEMVFTIDLLKDAQIMNKRFKHVTMETIAERADVICLLFNANGIDKNDIVSQFCDIYEMAKLKQAPIEVVYIPMDESKDSMMDSYEKQANWFAMEFNEMAINILKHMFSVSSIPHIVVVKPNGHLVSNTGILDLEELGRNALISWLSTSHAFPRNGKKPEEEEIYGTEWNFARKKTKRKCYVNKFSPSTS